LLTEERTTQDPKVGLSLGHYGGPSGGGVLREARLLMSEAPLYRGTSLIEKHPLPWDPPNTPCIGLRQGPRGLRSLMSEVSLYENPSKKRA
jgi:hypothetical protein